MKGGMQVSPVVAGIVIVVVLAIAGFFIYKAAGPRGKVQMSPDQVKQMQKMMGQRPANLRPGASMPPGMGRTAPHTETPSGQ